jgi:hypothetical protein
MHKQKNRSISGTIIHIMDKMSVDVYPVVLEGIEIVINPTLDARVCSS